MQRCSTRRPLRGRLALPERSENLMSNHIMLNKRILAISITILAFTGLALADAGPEPGYVRVGAPLIITPQDDFAGYRFFLDSPGGFEEIKLAKGKTTTISTEGRAGSMKYTSLIAISNQDLGGAFDGPATPERMDALQAAIKDKKVNGVIELALARFRRLYKEKGKENLEKPDVRTKGERGQEDRGRRDKTGRKEEGGDRRRGQRKFAHGREHRRRQSSELVVHLRGRLVLPPETGRVGGPSVSAGLSCGRKRIYGMIVRTRRVDCGLGIADNSC